MSVFVLGTGSKILKPHLDLYIILICISDSGRNIFQSKVSSTRRQSCGFKNIEFRSGSRILAKLESGSRVIINDIDLENKFKKTPYASNLSYFYLCGSNLDPDPQPCWQEYRYLRLSLNLIRSSPPSPGRLGHAAASSCSSRSRHTKA